MSRSFRARPTICRPSAAGYCERFVMRILTSRSPLVPPALLVRVAPVHRWQRVTVIGAGTGAGAEGIELVHRRIDRRVVARHHAWFAAVGAAAVGADGWVGP